MKQQQLYCCRKKKWSNMFISLIFCPPPFFSYITVKVGQFNHAYCMHFNCITLTYITI